jgi:hypothetical protein
MILISMRMYLRRKVLPGAGAIIALTAAIARQQATLEFVSGSAPCLERMLIAEPFGVRQLRPIRCFVV